MRRMFQAAPNTWVIQCRICAQHKAVKKTAATCHDWWRQHIKTKTHAHWVEQREAAHRRVRGYSAAQIEAMTSQELYVIDPYAFTYAGRLARKRALAFFAS